MSDKPIAANDLVIVVHAHCDKCLDGAARIRLGQIFKVSKVEPCSWTGDFGFFCGAIIPMSQPIAQMEGANDWFSKWYPTAWLKRIDPLSEPESVERKEEIPA